MTLFRFIILPLYLYMTFCVHTHCTLMSIMASYTITERGTLANTHQSYADPDDPKQCKNKEEKEID